MRLVNRILSARPVTVMVFFSGLFVAFRISGAQPQNVSLPQSEPRSDLVWDGKSKKVLLNIGEVEAHMVFNFTNTSPSNIVITAVSPSCGCTTVQLPVLPWTISAGSAGAIPVSVDVAGGSGTLSKSVRVTTDSGTTDLSIEVGILPAAGSSNSSLAKMPIPMTNPDRGRNFQIAKVDRQAVFGGDCVTCHVQDVEHKSGKELYNSVCGICHESPHRATMVPDLGRLNKPAGFDFWQTWISFGKTNSLMPAFAKSEGGPLTKDQIVSLATYLMTVMPAGAHRSE
jgi:mono/diheme cytochrome c family protein